MTKFLLVLLYVLNGEVTLERVPHVNESACYAAAELRVVELVVTPRFEGFLFAACLKLPVVEAKKP